MEKVKKPIYKKWWFWAIIAFFVIGIIGNMGEDEEEVAAEPDQEEADDVEEVEEEPEEEDGLTDDEVGALEEGLAQQLEESEDDLSIYSFEYEDDEINVWVDMQNDPLPTGWEAEDIIADVTWYLAEQNDVVEHPEYDVTALLVSQTGDDEFIHWLTEIYSNGDYDTTEEEAYGLLPEEEVATEEPEVDLSQSQQNAVGMARDYLNYTAFSKSGLVEQLEFEGFDNDDATFAVNEIDVDWQEQANQMAEDYLDYSNFSRSGLIEQLEFEGFSNEQATNAVDETGL